jgi:hypothetical protein
LSLLRVQARFSSSDRLISKRAIVSYLLPMASGTLEARVSAWYCIHFEPLSLHVYLAVTLTRKYIDQLTAMSGRRLKEREAIPGQKVASHVLNMLRVL